jgi:hypothetical protein
MHGHKVAVFGVDDDLRAAGGDARHGNGVAGAVAVALVASVVATVKSLLVAPVGAIFTVKVLVPPAVPVLVVGLPSRQSPQPQ